MKRIALDFAILLGFVLVAVPLYSRRAQVSATLWHWRHGSSAVIGDYTVPVPDHWLPEIDRNEGMITLLDTRPAQSVDPLGGGNVISISVRGFPFHDLNAVVRQERQRLERQGLKNIEEHAILVGDERIQCFGGTELRDLLHLPATQLLSSRCYSTGRLSLGFTGDQEGLQEFYLIVSRIRKRG